MADRERLSSLNGQFTLLNGRTAVWGIAVALIFVFLPLYQLDPNRVTSGPPVYFFKLLTTYPNLWSGLLVVIVLIFLAGVFQEFFLFLLAFLLWCLPTLTWPGGTGLSQELWISPSLGFWLVQGLAVYRALVNTKASRLGIFLRLVVLGVATITFVMGGCSAISVVKEADPSLVGQKLWQHLSLTAGAMAGAVILGFPLGVASFRFRWGKVLLQMASVIQTIPSIALFGLLMIPLAALVRAFPGLQVWGVGGIGPTPAEIALTLWAILPLASAVQAGLAMVPPEVIHAAYGLGFSSSNVFWKVELPLALPSALAGFRLAFVQTVGNATLAPLIGGGGLGWFIFQGIGQTSQDMVVLGVLLVLIVSGVADQLLKLLVKTSQRRLVRASSAV
ncbi:MAG: ABC transporter permease [Spirochaetales bacterium]|nr:ABC transporter permease [Spirochaetales bacterium]